MRDLIELAADKDIKKFFKRIPVRFFSIGSEEETDEHLFDKELEG